MGEAIPALSIGAVDGGFGPELKNDWSAVSEVMREVKARRSGLTTALCLNVVFQFPGKYFSNDYSGWRTGKFTRTTPELMVQYAVPAEGFDALPEGVHDAIDGAIDIAEEFAVSKGIDGSLDGLRSFVERLRAQ